MENSVKQERRKTTRRAIQLGIAKQLTLLALIPASVAIGFMTIIILREINARNQAKQVGLIVGYMATASHVIHQLQKERGISVGYISSKGTELVNELNVQSIITDKKFSELQKHLKTFEKEYYGRKFAVCLDSFLEKMRELPSKRDEIKALSDADGKFIDYFSDIISKIINSFQEANLAIKNTELSFPFAVCVNFIMAKEMAGIEMAIIVGIVAKDGPINKSDLNKWMRVSKGQEALFSSFEHQTSGETLRQFYMVSGGINAVTLDEIRNKLVEKQDEGKFGMDPAYVFSMATRRIDNLKNVEDLQTSEILHISKRLYAEKTRSLIIYLALAVAVIVVIFIFCFRTVKSITSQITMLTGAVKRVASGKLDHEIEIKTGNEIGELTESFNEMLRNLRQMREKNELHNWLKTGQAELYVKMHKAKDFENLGYSLISYLAIHLNAQIGVIYIADKDDTLKLTGSFAYSDPEKRFNEFRFGEGLVGQAALRKKSILTADVPDDYFKIDTGWGSAIPRYILDVPLLYKGNVKGVIELGSCKKFTVIQVEFLNMVAENIAVIFDSEQSRFGKIENGKE